MKKKDLIALYTVLNKLSHIKSTKFAYFIMKNLKILESEIDIIRELNKLPVNYLAYEQKRIGLCEKFAEKDDQGNAVKKDNNFIINDKEEFDKEIAKLIEKYKEAIDEKSKKDLEITEFLMEDSEVKFHKIKFDNLPELSAKHLMTLEELIDFD